MELSLVVDYAGLAQRPRLGWIGKERDAETDFGNFGVRNYEFGTGRFLSGDALWEEYRGWSMYHYSSNSPTIASDPSGLELIFKAATKSDEQWVESAKKQFAELKLLGGEIKAAIDDLEKSEHTHIVEVSLNGKDNVKPNDMKGATTEGVGSGTLYQYSVAKTAPAGFPNETEVPIEVWVSHEIGHMHRADQGKTIDRDVQSNENPKVPMEERQTIIEYENPARRALNVPIRTEYNGHSLFIQQGIFVPLRGGPTSYPYPTQMNTEF